MKRFISIAISFILAFTLCQPAFAATVSDDTETVWEVANATELEAALNGFQSDDTIKLTAGFTYNKGIVIDGKNVTFDTGSFTLNVYNVYSSTNSAVGLEVKNGGNVYLIGSGQLYVRQIEGNTAYGVKVTDGSTATVTNIQVTAYMDDAAVGAYADDTDSSIHVLGNVHVMGTGGCGAKTWGNGRITVDETITATIYINIGSTYKDISSGVDDPAKPGYLKYCTDPVTGIVWVKAASAPPDVPQNFTATPGDGQVALSWTAPASDGGAVISGYEVSGDNGSTWVTASTSTSHTFTGLTNGTEYTFKVRAVNSAGNGAEASAAATPTAPDLCEIGTTKYTTLNDALAAVTSGQTIKLLNNITHTSPIEVDGKTIYFELGNYNLLVDTSTNPDESIYYVLTVKNGGKIRLAGTGTGKFNVRSTSDTINYGVRVLDAYSEVTVNNVDVTDDGAIGVYMYGSGLDLAGGTITVNGHIIAGDMGVNVNAKNGSVIVNGDITAGHSGIQVAANPGTIVTVNGNINVLGTTWQSLKGAGILASGQTTVKVTGDVTGQGTNYTGVHAQAGSIEVEGDVISSGIGAKAEQNVGYPIYNGAVTIDGSLSAGTPFIIVGTTEKSAADISEPTTKTGYLTYSDGTNNVWIRSVGAPVVTVPAVPQNFTATPGDGQVALSWAAPASDGGAAISGYEVSSDNGSTWVTASTSTSHTFTGLTNGTEYTFKVRAVNSAGNGAEVSAIATPVNAPSPPSACMLKIFGQDEFSGYVSVYNAENRYGQAFTGKSEVTLEVLPGVYTIEADIAGVGRKVINNFTVSEDGEAHFSLPPAATVAVTVTGGTPAVPLADAFVVVFAQDGTVAGSGLTGADGKFSLNIPAGSRIKYYAKKAGYTDYLSDPVTVAAGAVNLPANLTQAADIPVNGTISADDNFSSAFLWATETGTGAWVGKTISNDNDNQADYSILLPKAGTWMFSVQAEGFNQSNSDDIPVTQEMSGVNLTLDKDPDFNPGSQTDSVGTTGGQVDNAQVGVQLIIPANTLTGDSNITTSATTVIPATAIAQPVKDSYGIEINATDSNGDPITNLAGDMVEIVLDYSAYAHLMSSQQMAALRLAYWREDIQDWEVIPSINDTTNHILRGYTDHFTKFAMVYPQTLVLRGMEVSSGSSWDDGPATVPPGTLTDSELAAAIAAAGKTGKISLAAAGNFLALTPDQINELEEAAKPVEIKVGGLTFSLLPSALKAAGLNLDNVSSISLGAEKVADSRGLLEKAANKYKVVGDVYQLTFKAQMKDKTGQDLGNFNGKVIVSMPVPETAGEAAAGGGLVACRYNETTGEWDPVTGAYDPESRTFSFETGKFSRWALMRPVAAFTDLAGHWAREEIEYMAAKNYVSGMGGGKFAPEAPVTRAQFATMLVNVLKPAAEAGSPFTDLTPGQWFYSSVCRAYAAGLVKGVDGTHFAPEDLITREQMAAMICNALNYKGLLAEAADTETTLASFADSGAVSGWARTPAAQAVRHGILKGKPANGVMFFAPSDRATRAEAAVMLKNLLGQMGQE